jgi:hypothetical protein
MKCWNLETYGVCPFIDIRRIGEPYGVWTFESIRRMCAEKPKLELLGWLDSIGAQG